MKPLQYPSLVLAAAFILSLFVSTGICQTEKEALESVMQHIIIPKFSCKNKPFKNVVSELPYLSHQYSNPRSRIPVELYADKATRDTPLTITMRNVSFFDIIKSLAESQKLKYRLVCADSEKSNSRIPRVELYDPKEYITLDINAATKNQLRRILFNANDENPFLHLPSDLRLFNSRITDYRDENHVLSTVSTSYGLEAVCFNELAAYDGSWIAITNITNSSEIPKKYSLSFSVPELYRPLEYHYRVSWVISHKDSFFHQSDAGVFQQTPDGTISLALTLPPGESEVTVLFSHPEIIELINISDNPVSLKYWTLIVNTGVEQTKSGIIEYATRYNPNTNTRLKDINPVIRPHNYYYLTSDEQIFALEHGNTNDVWGDCAKEVIPLSEILDLHFPHGRYSVLKVSNNWVYLAGLRLTVDQFAGEIAYVKGPGDVLYPFTIEANTQTCIKITSPTALKLLKTTDSLWIRGIPREGGIISLTLQNEYDQITARTALYESLKSHNPLSSAAKPEPTTPDIWYISCPPTIGGTPDLARNSNLTSPYPPFIRNNDFVSLSEILPLYQQIQYNPYKKLSSLYKYFTLNGIRLEAEQPGAHSEGWQLSCVKAASASASNSVTASNVHWDPGMWATHTLRVMSGKLKGESFRIVDNSVDAIVIAGHSTEQQKIFGLEKNDAFCLGPGYQTPLYYTRKQNLPGIWEWQHSGLTAQVYALYIFGLNDSTYTTEFLEECFNSTLDISIYNFKSLSFDNIPLTVNNQFNSIYSTRSKIHQQYNKNDQFYCGLLSPDYISNDGRFRIKISSIDIGKYPENSGFAWFDYLYLVPVKP